MQIITYDEATIVVKFGNDWDEVLAGEFDKEYYLKLRKFLIEEYSNYTIYPDMHKIFAAQKAVPYSKVKVVILGQDPYIGANQAHGLCFSVQPGIEPPPSLVNIFKEVSRDTGAPMPKGGCLQKWADQGVLLLNTVLTVRAGLPNSHSGKGWEIYTDTVIKRLSERKQPVVFMLWGNNARSKKSLIAPHHLILEAPHPSPLSAHAGFFGCGHFSKANKFLIGHGIEPIDWTLDC